MTVSPDPSPAMRQLQPAEPVNGDGEAPPLEIDMHALETYLACPRRYYYEHRLELRGSPGNQFLHFHTALRRTLARVRDAGVTNPSAALTVLDEEWACAHDPHPLEALFRERARRAVLSGVAANHAPPEPIARSMHGADYRLVRPAGTILVQLDRLDQPPGEAPVAVRYRTGRPSDEHRREHRTAVYQAALTASHGDGRVQQEYLLNGSVDDARARPATLEGRLRDCDAALEGIGNGHFMPRPTDECPACPFWLICPDG